MKAPIKRFSEIAERYLDQSWALFPHEASELGLHQFDGELGENSAQTWQSHGKLLAETLQAVEALPDHAFTGDDWLDRRGFLSLLRTRLHWSAGLERWRNDPQVHCDAAINSVFHLLLRNADKLARIRPAIEARLAKIPSAPVCWPGTRSGPLPNMLRPPRTKRPAPPRASPSGGSPLNFSSERRPACLIPWGKFARSGRILSRGSPWISPPRPNVSDAGRPNRSWRKPPDAGRPRPDRCSRNISA